MIIPKNETRIFNTEILQNGIKTVCVYDKDTDKTTVTVSINIGSYSNPKEYQGLAHFLEHMLFLGSKKYPDEDHYEKVVKQFGGSSNAYTDLYETVYYFSAFNNGIKLIMDVFSRFFIDPIFNEDSVKREINAINNEHLKNINDDHWRQYQLNKNIAKSDNSYHTFPTGSIQSLSKEGLRNKMIEFWNDYYVSDNINICVISNLEIKEQQTLLKNTFGYIPKKTGLRFKLNKPIYDKFNITYQMIPLSDTQHLNYYWEIPATLGGETDYIKNKLFVILGDVLVKQEKNSFINHLKIMGFIEGAYVNYHHQEGLYSINFHLTKLGCDNLNYIDGTLKYALDKIFNHDWNKIVSYYKKIYEINFYNMKKLDNLHLANSLCVNMAYYPITDILASEFLVKKIESNPVELLKPFFKDNFKILVLNSKLEKPIIDKNYKTKYGIIKNIDSGMIEFPFSINLFNPFLNMKPKFIKKLDCEPILIKDRVWYGGCSKFNESLIEGVFILNNLKFFENEKNYLLTNLLDMSLTFYINQEIFNIQTLQYHFSINAKPKYNSLLIEYSCPNDPIKFNNFIDLTLKLIKNPKIPEIIIKNKIQTLKEAIINKKKLNPWEYSSYYFYKINQNNEYDDEKLLIALSEIKPNEVNNFTSNLFEGCSLTSFFYGNLNKDQVPNVDFLNKLCFNNLSPLPIVYISKEIKMKHPNKNEKNNCVSLYFYTGSFVPLTWLNLFILYLILERKFYTELRTKKQLGYLVHMSYTNHGDNHYILQKIQSDKSCNIILKEIEEFNKHIINIINKENLDEWLISAGNHLNEKDTSLNQMYHKYLTEILNRKYLFNRKKLVLQQIKNINKESIINHAKKYILNNINKSVFFLEGN